MGKNVRWGMLWGLAFAAAYSLLAAVLFLLGGLGQESGVRFGAVIASYVAGGIAGGAVVGLAASIPIVLGFCVALSGLPPWEADEVFGMAMTALLLGSGSRLAPPTASTSPDDPQT